MRVNSASISVHPLWNGNVFDGADIAIIKTNNIISTFVPIYELYRKSDELGQISVKVGYGRSGSGSTGVTENSGIKRKGKNSYDIDGRLFSNVNDDGVLMQDFDNGLTE